MTHACHLFRGECSEGVGDQGAASTLAWRGLFTASGLITHHFPLARWKEAVRTAADKRSGAIKVVFDYR